MSIQWGGGDGRIYTAFYGKLDKMKIISTGTVPFHLCVMSLACTLRSNEYLAFYLSKFDHT